MLAHMPACALWRGADLWFSLCQGGSYHLGCLLFSPLQQRLLGNPSLVRVLTDCTTKDPRLRTQALEPACLVHTQASPSLSYVNTSRSFLGFLLCKMGLTMPPIESSWEDLLRTYMQTYLLHIVHDRYWQTSPLQSTSSDKGHFFPSRDDVNWRTCRVPGQQGQYLGPGSPCSLSP